MSTEPSAADRPPLDGVLVADFSRVLAGPMATMMLADLGAEVVKVERPGTGDDTRAWGPPWTTQSGGTSASYFECVNRSKRSVAWDLGDADDRAAALELIARADVLVENFKTGALDRLGLGYAALAELNPRLIYCSITGFGSGAGADLPGYDFAVQAVGGLMSITGHPDADGGEPTKVGVALVDVLTGKDAVIGILAALAERERSGRGQHIEVNLLSSLLGSLVNQAATTLTTGVSPGRLGNQHPSIAPYETVRCRDGRLVVTVGNDRQFAAMTTVLFGADGGEIAADPRFATNGARVAHRAELIDILEAALVERDAAEWAGLLAAAGVPCGEVNDIVGAIELADGLGLAPTVDLGPGHPRQIRHPITWGRSPLRP
ncbi:MAG: CoA transferase, partial [Nocardioides sp.]